MRRLFSVPSTIMLMVAAFVGCDFEIPKIGSIVRGDTSSTRDTSLTTIGGPDATSIVGSDGNTSTTHDISSSTDGNTVIDITDSSSSTPDSLDPPDVLTSEDGRDGYGLNMSCNTDTDCTKLGSNAFICVEGFCIEYLECTQDWHCNNHNACDGEEKCSEHGEIGYCIWGEPLECPGNSTCNPVGGCVLPAPPARECSDNADCLSTEECADDIGGVCTIADGSACSDANECDDFNACTYASCKSSACKNEYTICADRNPGTKDRCEPFTGCIYSTYIFLEVTLKVPHDRDMVWLRFDNLTWLGRAPYIMHIPVLEACSEGIRLDFKLESDSEDGWYECPGNPLIANTIDSIVIDGDTLHEEVPQANRYNIVDDPDAPCGKSLLISRGDLNCPFGL